MPSVPYVLQLDQLEAVSKSYYKSPYRYHCGCGYACTKKVIWPHMWNHVITFCKKKT